MQERKIDHLKCWKRLAKCGPFLVLGEMEPLRRGMGVFNCAEAVRVTEALGQGGTQCPALDPLGRCAQFHTLVHR